MLPTDISLLLHTTRPDVATWAALCRHLDVTTLSSQQLGEVKKALWLFALWVSAQVYRHYRRVQVPWRR
jgi:hypothetical protein